MKAFELWSPRTLDQALAVLAREGGAARPLAGGQDLLTEMKAHLAEPDALVDLRGVGGLDAIEAGADRLSLGAMATLARIARDADVRAGWPALAEAAESVGSPQIRNRATLGGNLCQRPRCWYYRNEHAPCLKKGGSECFAEGGLNKYNAILGGGPSFIVHPSDLAPALVCLDAVVRIGAPAGEREMPLQDFFTLPSEGDVRRENRLERGELVLGVRVPRPPLGARSTYLKFQERESFDFALASVALALWVADGRIAHARLCLGGVAPVPWRCESTERLLVGRAPEAETWKLAAEEALKGAQPLEQNGYKVPLARGLIRKALARLG